MEILCSFRLVLEGKKGKEIPESSRLKFLEKFFANNFALSDAEDNTSGPLNKGGIANLPMLRTLLALRQKSREPNFWEVKDSFVLVAYASLAASRTLLQWLLACLNFTLDSGDLFFWYKRKMWFLWIMAATQAAKNHGDAWGLTWFLRWGIYVYINSNLNPLTKFTSSSRGTEFKDILPYHLSTITKTIPMSTTIVISHAMKRGILSWVYWKVNGNWDNNMIRISKWRESHCRTNASVRRKKQIQKSKTVTVTVRDPSRKVKYLSKVVWDRKIIKEFTRSISSTRIG